MVVTGIYPADSTYKEKLSFKNSLKRIEIQINVEAAAATHRPL